MTRTVEIAVVSRITGYVPEREEDDDLLGQVHIPAVSYCWWRIAVRGFGRYDGDEHTLLWDMPADAAMNDPAALADLKQRLQAAGDRDWAAYQAGD